MNDNVKNDNRPKILKDLDPFNAPRSLESTISSDNEPETEIPAAPAKNKNSSSQRKRGRSGKLPRADVPGFNGTSQVLEDDKESSQQDSVSSVTQNDSSRAKKPKKEPGVTKALDSELGPFWAPQVGADGGRPKRKPNTNS